MSEQRPTTKMGKGVAGEGTWRRREPARTANGVRPKASASPTPGDAAGWRLRSPARSRAT